MPNFSYKSEFFFGKTVTINFRHCEEIIVKKIKCLFCMFPLSGAHVEPSCVTSIWASSSQNRVIKAVIVSQPFNTRFLTDLYTFEIELSLVDFTGHFFEYAWSDL